MENLYIGIRRDNNDGLVFRSDSIPTRRKFGKYFDNVIGPFDTLKNVAKYCRSRQLSPKLFDKRSFRVITLGSKGKKGIIGCPKGKWSEKTKKCKVGTKLQSILIPVGMEGCVRGGMELLRKKNPYTRTGLYYPKKGSEEAYEWARKMRRLREFKRRDNPNKEYHDRKFLDHLRQTDKWKLGSEPYLVELGKAYAHLESAHDSVMERE